jgi:hypothetical protein
LALAAAAPTNSDAPLVDRTSDFLVAREKEISEFFRDAPEDIRIAVHEIIEHIKRTHVVRDGLATAKFGSGSETDRPKNSL